MRKSYSPPLINSSVKVIKIYTRPCDLSPGDLNSLVRRVYLEVLDIFSPRRRLSVTSIQRVKEIITDVLRYIYRTTVGRVVALPKEVFVRAHAHGGSMRTIFNYKTIRKAFERLGILKSLDVKTYKGGPCQHYYVDLGDEVKLKKDDEFVGKENGRRRVSQLDKYSIDILGDEVVTTGEKITEFAAHYERKLREYTGNNFVMILREGSLRKGPKLGFYVRGAAICQKYGYDITRFIEAQFFFFHQWKGEAADIQYVTSVYSTWSSIGRYEYYCTRFKDELDYFSQGEDNLECVIKDKPRQEPRAVSSQQAMEIAQADYERIKDGFGFTDTDLFLIYGHPIKPMLPLYFLMEQPAWLLLLQEKAWGEEVDNKFWIFLDKVHNKDIK